VALLEHVEVTAQLCRESISRPSARPNRNAPAVRATISRSSWQLLGGRPAAEQARHDGAMRCQSSPRAAAASCPRGSACSSAPRDVLGRAPLRRDHPRCSSRGARIERPWFSCSRSSDTCCNRCAMPSRAAPIESSVSAPSVQRPLSNVVLLGAYEFHHRSPITASDSDLRLRPLLFPTGAYLVHVGRKEAIGWQETPAGVKRACMPPCWSS